jgi:hypothetical protein
MTGVLLALFGVLPSDDYSSVWKSRLWSVQVEWGVGEGCQHNYLNPLHASVNISSIIWTNERTKPNVLFQAILNVCFDEIDNLSKTGES